jgi:hypothetical protein
VVRIAFAEASNRPEEYGFLFVTAAFAALMASFGILGLVVHAAAGRGPQPPFLQVAALLFLPLMWLQLKIALVTYGPILAALTTVHALDAPTVPLETWVQLPAYWLEPVAEAVTLALTVYATPFAVRQRVTGKRNPAVRWGLRLMVSRAEGGPWLLLLLLPAIAIGTTAHFLRAPTDTDPVPNIPEGLALLVISYLTLAGLFGSARLLARRAAAAALEGRVPPGTAEADDERGPGGGSGPTAGAGPTAAPGPPA